MTKFIPILSTIKSWDPFLDNTHKNETNNPNILPRLLKLPFYSLKKHVFFCLDAVFEVALTLKMFAISFQYFVVQNIRLYLIIWLILELLFTPFPTLLLLCYYANIWEINIGITWKAPDLHLTVFWFSKIDKFDQRLALHQNGLDFHHLRFNDAIRTTVAAPYKIFIVVH